MPAVTRIQLLLWLLRHPELSLASGYRVHFSCLRLQVNGNGHQLLKPIPRRSRKIPNADSATTNASINAYATPTGTSLTPSRP